MEGQNIKLLVESEGSNVASKKITELVRNRKIKLINAKGPGKKIRLGELFEAFIGKENLFSFKQYRGYVEIPLEEGGSVKVSHFTNITGELLANILIDAYDRAAKMGDSLTDLYETKYRDERVAGFSACEYPKEVKEGDTYEDSGINEKYVTPGTAIKMGRIISVTEEAVFFDQTSNLVQRIEGLGEACAQEREERILKAVTGETNCYYPSGSVEPLYQAAPYLITSNPLTDYTSIEKALVDGFSAMRNENGKPILVMPNAILVPEALKFKARTIINASEITQKTPTSGTSGTTAQAYETRSVNPVDNYEILGDPMVSYVQSSDGSTNWWIGNFKRQFKWRQIWPLQTFRFNDPSVQFSEDTVVRYKVRYFGNCFAVDKRYVIKCKAGA